MFRNKIGTTNLRMVAPDIAKRRDYTNKIKGESTGERPCFQEAADRALGSDQPSVGQFILQVSVINRRRHHAGDAERRLHHQHGEQ